MLLVKFVFFFLCYCKATFGDITPNYFCADMNPQPHVIINQLLGMWFGVEIINHLEEIHYVRREPSCPIIHISEAKTPSTTYRPLHRNYNYDYNYGEGRAYTTNRPYVNPDLEDIRKKMRLSEQYEYDRQTTYGDHDDYPANRVQHLDTHRDAIEMRYLRLYWDENGETTEFFMRYNVTKAGFWISSGPQHGGATLDPQYGHFAGTIQVIKAVGNHLVLTFCHQLPKRQLYTIILSRQLSLDHIQVHGVHNMLNRKGLTTNSVKKVCSGAASYRTTTSSITFSIITLTVISTFWISSV